MLWSGIQGEWMKKGRTISFNGGFIAAKYILCGCNLFLRVENKLYQEEGPQEQKQWRMRRKKKKNSRTDFR